MFDKQYRFYGAHARKVDELTQAFENVKKAKLFDTAMNVYVTAVKVGYLYKVKAERDKSPGASDIDKSIFAEDMLKISEECKLILRMIILTDVEYEPDKEKRLDKAFRHLGEDENDLKLFDSYLLGGVDLLYDKLIADASTVDDYINNLYFFLEDFHEKFNEGLSSDVILELCKNAESNS